MPVVLQAACQRILPSHRNPLARLHDVKSRAGWLIAAILIAFAAVVFAIVREWPFTRTAVERTLSNTLGARVTISEFHSRWFPQPGFDAAQVQIAMPGGPIAVRRIAIRSSYSAFLRRSRALNLVHLEGLSARLPRHPEGISWNDGDISIGELVVDGSQVEFEGENPADDPLRIGIEHVDLHGISPGHAVRFNAVLDWAKPNGRLEVDGRFGPLSALRLSTPVSGKFRFENASLAVFQNLSGNLSSEGKFQGPFGQIRVDGITRVVDLKVDDKQHHQVNIQASFSAVVNGANADTRFDSIDTTFLGTHILWHGEIVTVPDPGKVVSLEMTSREARVQDLLYVATQAPRPAMSGPIVFHAHVVLSPDHLPFLRKLRVDGDFHISNAQFTKLASQSNVAQLSERARGEKKPEEDPEAILADVNGHVSLRNGVAALSNLVFRVPGASANLQGNFNVISYVVDLHGQLALEKELSQTTSGFKSVLLKAVDPLFKRRHAGAVVPVSITGTYQSPVFSSLGMHRGASSGSK